jgi:hypothetical protein
MYFPLHSPFQRLLLVAAYRAHRFKDYIAVLPTTDSNKASLTDVSVEFFSPRCQLQPISTNCQKLSLGVNSYAVPLPLSSGRNVDSRFEDYCTPSHLHNPIPIIHIDARELFNLGVYFRLRSLQTQYFPQRIRGFFDPSLVDHIRLNLV